MRYLKPARGKGVREKVNAEPFSAGLTFLDP